MNAQRFIAKQHVKYYWKVIMSGPKSEANAARTMGQPEPFLQYEKTPRVVV